MNVEEFHKKGEHIRYDLNIFKNIEEVSFKSQVWAQRSAIVGFAEGRGTTFFIQHQGRDFVLRHYQRGGLIAKMSQDQYLWTGLRFSRPWREWNLLEKMQRKGLPVPSPAAVRVERTGLFYTADIMMHRIPNSRTLIHILMTEELAEGYWIAIGSVIRRFHEEGVYHADLNANNILLDEGGRCYLIDFDRCEIRKSKLRWQQDNLSRLKRSLNKMLKNENIFYYSDENWRSLLRGYGWDDISVEGSIK
ncbi:MAG: 3-deoxy-D-manno-octulosonic acid kinase [Gammaproteobacteria bacterium]|nr:3-deoxy-D-manno-octulosonic acid kinase [Gammaproteobacteria bacterium]MDH5659491.1 3-deoxy-D-manno-octulosonic acid kinase [Gammaproteobacteria bacterium]